MKVKQSLWYTGPVNTSHGVGPWEHICSLRQSFEINIRIKVGNGGHARFWQDAWRGHRPLKKIYQDLNGFTTNSDIAWSWTVGIVAACALALEGIALIGVYIEWLFCWKIWTKWL